MNKTYKAIEYDAVRHHDATTGEHPWDNEPAYDTIEKRFCIVSTETGEILDDAQGYGYKTAQKAYAAYGYKTRDGSKDEAKRQKKEHIKDWMRKHKGFVRFMDEVAFEIAKGSWGPNNKFDAKRVQELLDTAELSPDFTAAELLAVWRKR